jgi:hypothetical protein
VLRTEFGKWASCSLARHLFVDDENREIAADKPRWIGAMCNMWIHLLRRGLYAFLIFALVSQSDAAGVKLRWQPNPESDLAGYRVHYGTKSDEYEHKIDVGKQTEHRLDNLQESVVYYFSLTAYDQTGNESPYSNQVSFKLGDTTPPLIASVAPLSLTEIQVRFSETVEAASANLASNYQIADGPKVLQAALQSDQQTVHLKTEAHQNGKQYTLSVQNIKDRALPPNTIAAQTTAIYSFASGSSDTTPPTLVLATLAKATELHVFFSEPVTAGSAEEKANYSIQPGIQVLSASLDAGGTVATLQTTEHQSGQSYILTVNNIKDRAAPANAIAINSRYTYSYAPGDIVGPMISLVSLPDARHVEILFNETLDETSAEQATHYTIDNSIAVHSASLDASGRIVTLETDAHVADKAYMLTYHKCATTASTAIPFRRKPLIRTSIQNSTESVPPSPGSMSSTRPTFAFCSAKRWTKAAPR